MSGHGFRLKDYFIEQLFYYSFGPKIPKEFRKKLPAGSICNRRPAIGGIDATVRPYGKMQETFEAFMFWDHLF